jgi:RNA-directed DNA polymerase
MSQYGRTAREGQGRKSRRQDAEESDSGIVLMNHSNKDERQVTESGEGRPLIKENTRQPNMYPTQSGGSMSHGLERVRQAAKGNKQLQFTALLHHLTVDLLRESFYRIKQQAAPGVDGVTWSEYETGLEGRLNDLHGRVHRGAYRAQPSRRVYIPKADGRQRPLGVAALEDKLVQRAVATILQQIYEEDFLGFSYGFRPGRNQHQALDALWVALTQKKVNYVLDADIRGFFDHLHHEWLMKFVRHRVADPRLLRLIQKWLKAGVMEEERWSETEEGTPQGSALSPLLGNIYLHYVLDLWVEVWRRKCARGDVIVVRYADDSVLGFQYQEEADRFLKDLGERLGKFGLELHPEKTRRIEFGRWAGPNRKRKGKGKPETFDFLGFTHISGKTSQGHFTVRRKTIAKRMRAKLQALKRKLAERRHEVVPETGKWLKSVVQGYFNFHAVPGNLDRLGVFRERLSRYWRQQLLRRSQKHRQSWERMHRLLERWLPRPRQLHPLPAIRFAVRIQDKSRMR